MKDMSINLPSWAVREGYRLEGTYGTYGELYLLKGVRLIKYWPYDERIPNIFEMEDLILDSKNKEAR